jgi:hypothetical protein
MTPLSLLLCLHMVHKKDAIFEIQGNWVLNWCSSSPSVCLTNFLWYGSPFLWLDDNVCEFIPSSYDFSGAKPDLEKGRHVCSKLMNGAVSGVSITPPLLTCPFL